MPVHFHTQGGWASLGQSDLIKQRNELAIKGERKNTCMFGVVGSVLATFLTATVKHPPNKSSLRKEVMSEHSLREHSIMTRKE